MSLLDTPAEERFDRLTRIAKITFGVPVALIGLTDSDRQWFKSKQGVSDCQASRADSFCGHTILHDDVMWIEDATKDARFHDNPMVTATPGLRFYAGVPLTNLEGHRIGTLCLVDWEPRPYSEAEAEFLKGLGKLVHLELAASAHEPSALRFAPEDPAERRELIDSESGCWNGVGIRDVVSRGLECCARTQQSAAVLLLRVVNGSDGSAAELPFDAVEQVAQTLRRSARNYDPIGRLDHASFLVFLVGFDESRMGDVEGAILGSMARCEVFREGAVQLELGRAVFHPKHHQPDASWLFELANDDLHSGSRLALPAA
jgi:hypothetical protein